MQEANPSPYEFLLQFGDEQLVGASPEMFVRVEGRARRDLSDLRHRAPHRRSADATPKTFASCSIRAKKNPS